MLKETTDTNEFDTTISAVNLLTEDDVRQPSLVIVHFIRHFLSFIQLFFSPIANCI